jgi:hypothetical protein
MVQTRVRIPNHGEITRQDLMLGLSLLPFNPALTIRLTKHLFVKGYVVTSTSEG